MWLDHEVVPWLSSVYHHTRALKTHQSRLYCMPGVQRTCRQLLGYPKLHFRCCSDKDNLRRRLWPNAQISTSWYDQSALPPPHLCCYRATPWNSYKSLFQISSGISALYCKAGSSTGIPETNPREATSSVFTPTQSKCPCCVLPRTTTMLYMCSFCPSITALSSSYTSWFREGPEGHLQL